MRTCRDCGVKETLEAPFYKGTNNRCKSCTLVYQQEYRSRPDVVERERKREEKRLTSGKRRAYNLKALYGLTPEKYDEMLMEQGGACAICKSEDPRHRS